MPTYSTTKTYRGGFYTNKNTSGTNDRVYSAEDIRKPYDVIYSDGIKPDADGTVGDNLKVSSTGGLSISINSGFAKLGGAWFENISPYTISLDNPTDVTRYDCVILRNDDSESVREPSIYILSLDHIPTINDLTRSTEIYEVCLAYVPITSSTTSITEIVDTRTDGQLCNVMSGVGATVVRTYPSTYFTTNENETDIPIGISQYDRTRDTLTVFIEGRVTTNYTINDNESITLALALPLKNTRVDFEVIKNVNASGAHSVVAEVGNLVAEMQTVNNKLENHYYCNGTNDNVVISTMVEKFLSSGSTYDNMRIVIHGHFGATTPYSGSGTSTSPYIWMRAGQGSEVNRRVFLDFTDCHQINIACGTNTYNIIFFGLQVNIIGANVIATGGTNIQMFSLAGKTFVNAENCRFWITSGSGYIARGGDFKNCRGSVTTDNDNAYCFNTLNGGLLRIYGGEYYAYAPLDKFSTVIYVNSEQSGAIVNTYSMNCPTFARSNYVQTFAINCLTTDGYCSFTDTISALTIVANDQNIRGTIALSRPGLI